MSEIQFELVPTAQGWRVLRDGALAAEFPTFAQAQVSAERMVLACRRYGREAAVCAPERRGRLACASQGPAILFYVRQAAQSWRGRRRAAQG